MISAVVEPLVRVEIPAEDCALVTLNRPQAKNALSAALRRELVRLFDQELPGRARVVVLTGAGGTFCSGLDLKELGTGDPSQLITAVDLDVVGAMRRFEGPIIGAVDGAAVAGGFELALACDMLLASESARFADTHVRVGVLPGWGLSQVLPRRIGDARAKQLSFTGNFIDALKAEAWGIINSVLPQQELLPAALRLASDMLSALPETLRAYKRLIDDGGQLTLEAGLRLEQERSAGWAGGLSAAGLAHAREGVLRRGRSQAAGGTPVSG